MSDEVEAEVAAHDAEMGFVEGELWASVARLVAACALLVLWIVNGFRGPWPWLTVTLIGWGVLLGLSMLRARARWRRYRRMSRGS